MPNLLPDRQRRKLPRYLRIERGLFRDSRNGGLRHGAKRAGKVRWTSLKTPDRQQARLIMERLSPSAGQNGNFEAQTHGQPKPQVGAIVPDAQPRPVTPPQNAAVGEARQVDPVPT